MSKPLTMKEFFVFIFGHLLLLLSTALWNVSIIRVNTMRVWKFNNMKEALNVEDFTTKNKPLIKSSDVEKFCSDIFNKILYEM